MWIASIRYHLWITLEAQTIKHSLVFFLLRLRLRAHSLKCGEVVLICRSLELPIVHLRNESLASVLRYLKSAVQISAEKHLVIDVEFERLAALRTIIFCKLPPFHE